MFRAMLFVIVLTLVAGQNPTFCSLWCHHAGHNRASACEHQMAMSPCDIDSSDTCVTTVGPDASLVEEDGSSSTTGSTAITPANVMLTPVRTESAALYGLADHPVSQHRPLVLVLRI